MGSALLLPCHSNSNLCVAYSLLDLTTLGVGVHAYLPRGLCLCHSCVTISRIFSLPLPGNGVLWGGGRTRVRFQGLIRRKGIVLCMTIMRANVL